MLRMTIVVAVLARKHDSPTSATPPHHVILSVAKDLGGWETGVSLTLSTSKALSTAP
jgi:hypothetical protein